MAALRVLMANGSLQGGGAERVVATLSGHLRAIGHHVSIATLSGGGEVLDELQARGFETVSGLSRHNTLGIFSISARLKRLVVEQDIDIVHTHDLRSLVDVGACRRLTGGFRHVHTFHFGNYPHLPSKHLLLERVFSRTPDRLVAVGYSQRDSLARTLGLSRERVQVIWNGVDASPPMNTATPVGTSSRARVPVIGSVSAFFPQKGLPTLIDAARIVKGRGITFRLLLVGDGPLRAELEARVLRLGLGDVVEFTGWLPDAARAVLPTFDLFVQSSNWEAMSMVVLEAMAAGRPILATAVGDNPRVLRQDETGILVPPGDADALATGMIRLLQDEGLRSRLGRGAFDAYEAEFTARAMAQRYLATYHEVLA